MESEGRRLHKQSAEDREAGNIAESLYRGDDAMLAYDGSNDDSGFAELFADRSITLRNSAALSESSRMMRAAEGAAFTSLRVAQDSDDQTALALPLYNYAKVLELLGQLPEAIAHYSDAITHMKQHPPESHNRPSVLLDMQIHVSVAEYKNGDDSARDRLEEYVAQLEQTDEPSKFAKDVWVSGGYMKLADVYRDDMPKSQGFLSKAREIADANPELSQRRGQIEKLSQELSY